MIGRLIRLVCILALLGFAPRTLAAEPEPALDPALGLKAYEALVDQEFIHTRDALRMLAATENARSGDWSRIKGPLARLAGGVPASAAVWFARPDGSYDTVESGVSDQNLKDRGYFPGLMSGREVIGDLVVSKSTGKRSAIVAVPVLSGGRVIGALGVSMAMEKVAALVDTRIGFPDRIAFYALDARGQVALHRESSLLFEFAAELGSPTLTAATAEMLARPEGQVSYEFQGRRRTAIYRRSPETGWVYALRW